MPRMTYEQALALLNLEKNVDEATAENRIKEIRKKIFLKNEQGQERSNIDPAEFSEACTVIREWFYTNSILVPSDHFNSASETIQYHKDFLNEVPVLTGKQLFEVIRRGVELFNDYTIMAAAGNLIWSPGFMDAVQCVCEDTGDTPLHALGKNAGGKPGRSMLFGELLNGIRCLEKERSHLGKFDFSIENHEGKTVLDIAEAEYHAPQYKHFKESDLFKWFRGRTRADTLTRALDILESSFKPEARFRFDGLNSMQKQYSNPEFKELSPEKRLQAYKKIAKTERASSVFSLLRPSSLNSLYDAFLRVDASDLTSIRTFINILRSNKLITEKAIAPYKGNPIATADTRPLKKLNL